VLGERTLVMGVLNVTPDSFSDGGKYFDAKAAARRVLEMEAAGADIIDIGGESTRPGSEGISAETEMARVLPVLERLRGRPKTMQKRPFARDVMADVTRGLREALARARRTGIPRERVLLDPGIGFGKSMEQNCELLARLPELARLGCPLVVGTSRKTFLGALLGGARESERIWGTAASVAAAVLGRAHVVRVHDVAEMVQVVRVADGIARESRK
jgi:dihydropteroate synthase